MLTFLVTLVDHDLIAKLVYVTVPTQVNQKSACDVFHCPEIEGSHYHDKNESQDLLIDKRIQKEETKEWSSLKAKME